MVTNVHQCDHHPSPKIECCQAPWKPPLCSRRLQFTLPLIRSHTLNFLKIIYLFIYLERREGREKERERNVNVWLPLARTKLETWPETQAHALTGNQTSALSVTGQHSVH